MGLKGIAVKKLVVVIVIVMINYNPEGIVEGCIICGECISPFKRVDVKAWRIEHDQQNHRLYYAAQTRLIA